MREFVDEYFSGEWEQLCSFDFRALKDSEKYGCPDRNFDCDDTNIMRAVYVVLWSELFPNLNMNNFGYRRQYRGDTLNTFHTMFGREIEGKSGFFAGLEKYSPSEEMREKVRHYGRMCSNIGNYAVLPNYFACQTSLNCYRGTNDWHDFFDRFLIELYNVLTGAECKDETLKELVKVNDFCFSRFRGTEGSKALIKGLYLEDYCDDSGVPATLFAMNYHWKAPGEPEQYFCDAEKFLEKAEAIIRRRSVKIVELLKAKVLQG